MQVATVVAALAAAGGLIFSAWTGYWSIEVARDQLDQSQEDADRDTRQQAVLVSAWTQVTGGSTAARGEPGATSAFITNRSLDPINQVYVGIFDGTEADLPDTYTAKPENPKAMIRLGSLPPCSRVTIPARAVKLALFRMDPDSHYKVAAVSFVDVYGQRWARLSTGPLQSLKEVSTRSKDPDLDRDLSIWKAMFDSSEGLRAIFTYPGSGNSPVGAPKPLGDCGAAK